VPLETYLRSKGRNAVADALVASARQADQGIPSLGARQQPSKSQVNSATRALALLKTTAQNQVAPALDVSLGFSDADGD
jgi:predicted lipoprotein